jgi:hypothetical protein
MVKRLFRIFELSKNEQRVVLIVILVLITIAFIGYGRRVHRVRAPALPELKASPTPIQTVDEQ